MKCFHHPESDATGYCRNCGKALCDHCRRDVRGVVYCEGLPGRQRRSPFAAGCP